MELVSKIQESQDDFFFQSFNNILQLFKPKYSSFEEPLSLLYEKLSSVYEYQSRFEEAAKTLLEIPLESRQRYDKHFFNRVEYFNFILICPLKY